VATLPTRTYLTDDANLKLTMKTPIGDMRDVIAELGGHEAWAGASQLTISSGSITPVNAGPNIYLIETQGGASTDDLANIVTTYRPEGRILIIRALYGNHAVVVKNGAGGAGQIFLHQGVDFTLDETDKFLAALRIGTAWYELWRSWGLDVSSTEYKVFHNLGTAAERDVGTSAGNIPVLDGSARLPAVSGILLTGLRQRGYYMKAVEALVYNATPPATTGTWVKRGLNDISTYGQNEISGASLASNQITLPAGTYTFQARGAAYKCGGHKLRLYETTGGLTIQGESARSASTDDAVTHSFVSGRFTIAAEKIFELQHFAGAGGYFGWPVNLAGLSGWDIHSMIEFWKD
jgi:hypothetical protein